MLSEHSGRLLLVEPEQVLGEITQFRLHLLGYEVDLVASGEEALEKIHGTTPPDVVICDLTLPKMTGLEFIENLASDEATNRIPIMALSIEGDIESVQKAHKSGITDYLVAPFQPSVLEEKVTKLLQAASQNRLATATT